jgi:hypothetical protein
MDASINNPAGRLHRFLQYCYNNNENVQLHRVWKGYFGDSDTVRRDYAGTLAEISSLPEQMRSAIEGLPSSKSVPTAFLLSQIPELEGILAWGVLNQTASAAKFNERFGLGDLARLEVVSQILAGSAPTAVTTDVLQEIGSLGLQITELLASDETLESDVRDLLFELSEGIRRTVFSYAVRGPESLARERDLLVGRLVNNPQLAAKLLGHKEARHLVRKTVLAATVAMTFFNTTEQTVENVPKMIQHVEKVAEWLGLDDNVSPQTSKQITAPTKP